MMIKVPYMILNKCSKRVEKKALLKALKTGDIVRLHVVAAGDSPQEQRVKLIVRDAILTAVSQSLLKVPNRDWAVRTVNEQLETIENVARSAAHKEGYFGPVHAYMGKFLFPDRDYEGVLVPAGEYQALRVTLGEATGKNWWCILYPALCLSVSSSDPTDLGNVLFDWHIGDIFRRWF